jgi:hypothetical protein
MLDEKMEGARKYSSGKSKVLDSENIHKLESEMR